MECPLTTPSAGGVTILYRLWEDIKCVKGDMGNALTLFLNILYFTIDIIIIAYITT